MYVQICTCICVHVLSMIIPVVPGQACGGRSRGKVPISQRGSLFVERLLATTTATTNNDNLNNNDKRQQQLQQQQQ